MRHEFGSSTKKNLAMRVAHRCSNPGCRRSTTGPHGEPDKSISIGVAAHIFAASQGGPRYNPDMSKEQRTNIDNGIWLCESCARAIDADVERYSSSLLWEWKKNAEEAARLAIESPSLLDDAYEENKVRINCDSARRLHAALDEFARIYVGVINAVVGITPEEIVERLDEVNARMSEIDETIEGTGIYDTVESALNSMNDELIVRNRTSIPLYRTIQAMRVRLRATRSGMPGFPAPTLFTLMTRGRVLNTLSADCP